MTHITRSESPPAGNTGAADWLVEGGEMGGLIRSMDWAATPLGPIDGWPQSLRTTAGLCLSSNFPINIVWGPHHVQIYNDGYVPICADKHPHSMGMDFTECWASAFPVIGAGFRSALAGTAAFFADQRMFLDRLGYLEEAFFTFSFSPIRDETGEVGGIFHPVNETTATMLAQRHTRALRDVAACADHARTLEQSMASVLETLAQYDLDLPFVLFYRLAADGRSAHLAGATGLAAGASACPALVDLTQPSAGWPLLEVARSGKPAYLDDLAQRFPELRCGPYPEPSRSAFVMPIGFAGTAQPLYLMVVGASARLPMNEAYRSFFDLLAAAASTVFSNAVAHEAERNRAEALAAIDRAKTSFFTNVSHEFRTPLTLILGPLGDELAESEDRLPPRRRERVALAHRNSLRLLKLVNTLLDFSRIEEGRVQANYEASDLASLTAELASNFRAACERAGLLLSVDCPPLPQPVYVDRDMWEKIVLNLLSNAFKFTLEGAISVRLRLAGDAVELTIRDSGVGIPADDLPHVFERFYRGKRTRGRTHEGSGIGLALVSELVSLHGGTLRADSIDGQGTIFTLAIPLGHAHLPADRISRPGAIVPAAFDAVPYVEEALHWLPDLPSEYALAGRAGAGVALPHPAQRASGVRPRIVWADDNADMRAYVGRLLAERFEVEAVANGEQALAAVRRRRPDLVLSDVMMPGLDGFGLLRELRADPLTANTPIILLSARAGEEARVEGLTAGADDYLVKPFSARELLARVQAILEMSTLRRELERRLEQQVLERTSALLEANVALVAAEAEATEANRAKSRFLAAASHDLRQPLSALSIYASVLKNHVAPAGLPLLASLKDCVGSLSALLADLLDLSKLQAGVITPQFSDFPLGAALASQVTVHGPEARLKGLRLRCVPSRLTVRSDPVLFGRILGNLIGNAIRYTESGGVVVGCRRRQGKAWIEVWDSGIGIAASQTGTIFEEFRQLGDESRNRGSGLGLAIVARSAALLGLEITVRSWPGRGSVFALELPLGQARAIPAALATCRTVGRPLRIAVVDDNADVRDALTSALRQDGHQVAAAASGDAVLIEIGNLAPDVVISDYRLTKGETGFDVISTIRTALGMDLPAILITGDTDPRLLRSMADRGIIVLHKPLDMDALEAVLENVTNQDKLAPRSA
jgi:signal transduction histidine kinase